MRLGITLNNAAGYLLALDRIEEAWESVREGLELSMRTNDHSRTTIAIGHLAYISAIFGDPALGTRLLGYTDAAYQRLGTVREPAERIGYDRALDHISAILPHERVSILMAEGAAMTEDGAVAEALAIPHPRVSNVSQSA